MSNKLALLTAVLAIIFGLAGCQQPAPPGPTRPEVSPSPPAASPSASPAPGTTLRPPPLILAADGVEKPEKLGVSTVDVDVRIFGALAETRMTMVFSNPHGRPLGGDLYFPLPEGATVSGYALDIGGVMVDGVVVPKEKARRVLETEMRRGVDPGLAELSAGNVFKTRVFPIPARGTRTVSVSWIAGIEGVGSPMAYRLPLMFKDRLRDFHVRLEVVKGQARPVVESSGIPDLGFTKARDSFVAEARVKDQALTQDLVVVLPDVEKAPLQVEQGPDGAVYFVVHEAVADARGKRDASPLGKVTIFWDASGSRARTDHERELSLLRAFFARHKERPVDVSLVVFRVAAEPARRFTVRDGDASALLDALAEIAYDGATQIGKIEVPAGAAGDACLLFTDGLSNFGADVPRVLKSPLYVFSADTAAHHAFLQSLAARSGGAFFNLGRLADDVVLADMEKQPWSLLKVTAEGGQIEAWPQGGRPVQGRLLLAGRLSGDEAKITFHYGAGGQEMTRTTHDVRASDAVQGSLLRRFWAMQKVAELSVRYDQNEAEIIELGKTYGLVTPGTSLLVLETLDQYVAHEIEPPASLPDVRSAYAQAAQRRRKLGKQQENAKIERVLSMWRNRVAWWERKFEYPPDLKVTDYGHGGGGVPGGVRRDGVMASGHARPQHPAPAATMPGPATEARTGWGTTSDARPASRPEKADKGQEQGTGATIVIKPWNPSTPYLEALRKAPADKRLAVYLAQKKAFPDSPAFFLDCADFFFERGQAELGLQVLSNIAELELENAALLRILAHRLEQLERFDLAIDMFERARRMRMEEPQSHRDLALALAKRARKTGQVADYQRAMQLLNHVVMNQWDRFDEIEVMALEELNAVWAELGRKHPAQADKPPCDARLVKLLDVDIRILLTWDADLTDIDLHVVEPSGERAFYGHNLTRTGGMVSRDFTQGYGPEEYMVRRAMRGRYKVLVNYFGSRAVTLLGPVTVQAEVITDFGRPTEKRKSLTLRLTGAKDTQTVGEIVL